MRSEQMIERVSVASTGMRCFPSCSLHSILSSGEYLEANVLKIMLCTTAVHNDTLTNVSSCSVLCC